MISVAQLTFERFFAPVFQPVSFELSPGELLLLTGANGAGKTTLLRVLAGVLAPTAGHLDVRARTRAQVGHQLAIKEDLSVTENLRFARDFIGGGGPVDEAIDRLGLRRVANQLARTLSAGQRKRCALARLVVARAELWLLDEPYASLDAEGCARVDQMLAAHLGAGGGCVMATHGGRRPDIPHRIDLEIRPGGAP